MVTPFSSTNSPIVMSKELSKLDREKLKEFYKTYLPQLEAGTAVVVARRIPVYRMVADTVVDLAIVSVDEFHTWNEVAGDVIPKELNAPFVSDPYVAWDFNEEKTKLTTGVIVIAHEDIVDLDPVAFLTEDEEEAEEE